MKPLEAVCHHAEVVRCGLVEATKQRCETTIEECIVCSSRVGEAMIGKGRIRVEVGGLVK